MEMEIWPSPKLRPKGGEFTQQWEQGGGPEFYLEGQHNVLWLEEARADQVRWRVHAEDKEMNTRKRRGDTASKHETQNHRRTTWCG